MKPAVLPFEQARQAVAEQARAAPPTEPELVDLLHAGGRVLAETIVADRDFPPFPRAARDGYAVRAADTQPSGARLKVIGEIRAGAGERDMPRRLAPAEAVAIMTGAPAPPGADAVIMLEYTREQGGWVELKRLVSAGENIVARGEEARAADPLLAPGARLNAAGIALAAAVGHARVSVRRRPRVAILSTGDELVDIAAPPGPFQIRNSNSYSLAAQVERAGGLPVVLPIAPDQSRQLRHLIEEGLASDLLLLAGGVSVGKYDLVEQVLEQMGAEAFFTGALIQPGRPAVFGRARRTGSQEQVYFFGLPGNPVSTMVTFELFARVMVEALSGQPPSPPAFARARLKSEVRVKTGLTRFLPARLTGNRLEAEVELVGWHGSGDIAAAARANCYIVVPPDRERIAPGEDVRLLMA
jgi:molybdopterin molybdotransferase